VEDQRQGGAPAAQRGRTTLPVIFARRENARREEDGPASSRGRGASVRVLLREVPACGWGPADLVAAPRPEGSRPAGRGRPPARSQRGARHAGYWLRSRVSSRDPSMLLRARGRARLGPVGVARRRRAFKAVEKVVTTRRDDRRDDRRDGIPRAVSEQAAERGTGDRGRSCATAHLRCPA
jgi:hypothetical protein